MDMKFADKLIELRKKNGLSQEDLADKLNVSRQAVSKWERGIASPDTDNLIALAKIYNISLDELLGVDTQSKLNKESVSDNNSATTDEKEKSSVNINLGSIDIEDKDAKVHLGFDGIHIKDKDTAVNVDKDKIKEFTIENKKEISFWSILSSIVFLIATIVYLSVGFTTERGWEIGWISYLIAVVIISINTAIKSKQSSAFAFPVLITAIYVGLGMAYGWRHPHWIMFISIPIFYAITGPIDKYVIKNKPKISAIFVDNSNKNSKNK